MAVIDTDVSPSLFPFGYTGSPEVLRDKSFYAQGEVRFVTLSAAAVAIPGAGNNQRIVITHTLPANRAYSLLEFTAYLRVTVSGGTYQFGNFEALLTAAQGGSDSSFAIPLFMERSNIGESVTASPREGRFWRLTPPKGIFLSTPGDPAVLSVTGFNSNVNDVAYTLNSYARFAQYTVQQAKDMQVNSAQLVR